METFGCCSSYKECSETNKCLHADTEMYSGCQYKTNLENGRNFYKTSKVQTLNIDIETYSSVDLKKCGVYAYAASVDFEILLLAYSIDGAPTQIIDLAKGEDISLEMLNMLTDPLVIKTAYNANFERTCLASYLRLAMPAEQWRCTAVHAATLGMPPTLGAVAQVLGFPEDKQKMGVGYSLIKYFCCPCKPTKVNGGRTQNLPKHDMGKWEIFKSYCIRDVDVEQAVRAKLIRFTIPAEEQKLWELDQKINDKGIKVDRDLASNAIECDKEYGITLMEEAVRLTGLDNPKSVSQLKEWFLEAEGLEIGSLNKKAMPAILAKSESNTAKRVIELRQEMSKTSIKKYEAMIKSIGFDDRVRGLLQFYGANRTGRWAGRLIQVQNLPQNKLNDLELARNILKTGDYNLLQLMFESVSSTLSQLVRTAFIPSEGNRFIIADFSAIEARVIAWLAGEKWRMDVFSSHGKIYEASAAQMFNVPIESITKGNPLRQKGKIAELALGYGGSVGALTAMGALDMGLSEEELPELVEAWRQANPNIVKFWWSVGNAAIKAIKEKTSVHLQFGLTVSYQSGMMFIKLPSGRKLAYVKPKIEVDEKFGREGVTYEGTDQVTKKWGRVKTYGPKLVENIVQAVARDCLAVSMLRLDAAGYEIAMHVHDEVVLDTPVGKGSLEEACSIMGEPISWATGLPLRADGFETEFYKKD